MRRRIRRSMVPTVSGLDPRLLLSDVGGGQSPSERPPAETSSTDLVAEDATEENHGYIRIKKLNSGG